MKTLRLFLVALVVLSCNEHQLRTANDVRAELCSMAPLLPPSAELEHFKTACALLRPLSEVAARFERCAPVLEPANE